MKILLICVYIFILVLTLSFCKAASIGDRCEEDIECLKCIEDENYK